MPLALLLHDAFGSWQRDVAKLSGWNRLVDLEDALLARARGMFLSAGSARVCPRSPGMRASPSPTWTSWQPAITSCAGRRWVAPTST